MEGAPIRDGAVLVGADGRIAWVGAATSRPAPPSVPSLSLPGGIAVPGLVNVHSHLELTHLAGLARESAFPGWIGRVRALKDATAADEFDAAARLGVLQMWAQGVTAVGDTGSSGAAARALRELGGAGVAYQEVFGPDPVQAEASARLLEAQLDALAPCASPRIRLGVSPHAPYTVSDRLVREACAVAARRGLPVAMHVAESRDETPFVRDGSGPFADAQRRRGMAVAPRGRSTVAWLVELGVLRQRPLCIHAVQTDDEDIAALAAHDAPVAHCPEANRAHGHGLAPLDRWLGAGIRVGIGTDSVASRAPLDLRAAARATGLDARELLALLTTAGAQILGLESGVLAPGGWGDIAVFALAPEAGEPHAAALSGLPLATVVTGRLVYDGTHWPGMEPGAWRATVAGARRRLRATAGEQAASR